MKKLETIQLEHLYSQPPAKVWQALTEPALLARWWAAGDIRPEVGHRFLLDMGPFGKQSCVVLQVEEERLLKFRFAAGTLDTVITWQLVPEGTGTRLKLTHEGFNLDSPLGQQALQGMKVGWPQVLGRLEGLLKG